MNEAKTILEYVRDRLELIQVANGYNTDAGLAVLLGESVNLGPDDANSALLIELGDDVPPEHGFGDHSGESLGVGLPVSIHGYVRSDIDAPYLAREALIVDIKKAVELADAWPASVKSVERAGTRRFDREEGTDPVGGSVDYGIVYVETWGAP